MKCNFKGNIGRDAVLRKVHNGDREDSVLSIWVAENKTKRDGSKKTLWHKVTIWRGYAEKMVEWLKEGRKIFVEGECEAKFYTNKQNAIVPYIDIQADSIDLLDAKRNDDIPPEDAGETAEVTEVVVTSEEETPW